MKLESYITLIGAFSIQPKKTLEIFKIRDEMADRFGHLLVQFIGLFTGFVVIFYFFYPEVFWIEGSITSGPNLFVLMPANPNFMIWGVCGVYFFVSGLNHYIYLGIWFRIFLRYSNRQKRLETAEHHNLPRYSEYVFIQSFSLTHIGLLNVWLILWIYFFEKFNYAKVVFPVFDLTIPVLIQLIGICFFIVIKNRFEYLVNIYYLKLPKKVAILPIMVKMLSLIILILIAAQIIDRLAAQFA